MWKSPLPITGARSGGPITPPRFAQRRIPRVLRGWFLRFVIPILREGFFCSLNVRAKREATAGRVEVTISLHCSTAGCWLSA